MSVVAEVDLLLVRARVHVAQAGHEVGDLGLRDEVGLGQEDAVGEAHLGARLVVLVELLLARASRPPR